jgi:hypothetical protein
VPVIVCCAEFSKFRVFIVNKSIVIFIIVVVLLFFVLVCVIVIVIVIVIFYSLLQIKCRPIRKLCWTQLLGNLEVMLYISENNYTT